MQIDMSKIDITISLNSNQWKFH